MKTKADIGLIGLAVMGENLVLNMERNGYTVALHNRTVEKVDKFMNGRGKDKNFIGAHSIEEFITSLERPRKVMLLVKAGKPVDDFIEILLPHLEEGDIIIDGGNSHFPDTIRRTRYVESKGLLFIGTGVSGGEEGALKGPSIMPGGSAEAWPHVKEIFQTISAKVEDGTPCCDWVGDDGAGHFVKMVHNGIEYGDMQLISEAYNLMKNLLGMSADEMHEVFKEWNEGELDSYLIEITRDILGYLDEDGEPLVEKIPVDSRFIFIYIQDHIRKHTTPDSLHEYWFIYHTPTGGVDQNGPALHMTEKLPVNQAVSVIHPPSVKGNMQ